MVNRQQSNWNCFMVALFDGTIQKLQLCTISCTKILTKCVDLVENHIRRSSFMIECNFVCTSLSRAHCGIVGYGECNKRLEYFRLIFQSCFLLTENFALVFCLSCFISEWFQHWPRSEWSSCQSIVGRCCWTNQCHINGINQHETHVGGKNFAQTKQTIQRDSTKRMNFSLLQQPALCLLWGFEKFFQMKSCTHTAAMAADLYKCASIRKRSSAFYTSQYISSCVVFLPLFGSKHRELSKNVLNSFRIFDLISNCRLESASIR